jgi:hypothetical protein
MPPTVKSWKNAGDTPCRQGHQEEAKLDPSTPPVCAENLHFMLKGETRRASGPPVTRAQTTWEDVDKVS